MEEPLLAVGAGISSPSATDAIADNPSGLAYNRKVKLLAGGSSENRDFNPFSAQGRLLFGNGLVGTAFGLHTYKHGNEDRLAADYGLGAYADSLKSMVGVGGSTVLNKEDRVGDLHDLNVGILTNPYGGARIGTMLVGILNGVDYYAFGTTMDLNSGADLAIDFSSNRNWDGRALKTALGMKSGGFSMQFGYGFHLDNRASHYFRKGFGAGIHLALSKDFSIEGVYNHHSKYYAALTAGF
jgi:hypothetical protein